MHVWMYYVLALCLYCFIRFLVFSLCFIPIILMCGCRILIKITYLLTLNLRFCMRMGHDPRLSGTERRSTSELGLRLFNVTPSAAR